MMLDTTPVTKSRLTCCRPRSLAGHNPLLGVRYFGSQASIARVVSSLLQSSRSNATYRCERDDGVHE
jgi:hypothetical protein